jgi:hypothetical protein
MVSKKTKFWVKSAYCRNSYRFGDFLGSILTKRGLPRRPDFSEFLRGNKLIANWQVVFQNRKGESWMGSTSQQPDALKGVKKCSGGWR